MTPKVITATPHHIWAHLLCEECEGRLNKFGENEVLPWLDNNKGFRLLERMRVSNAMTEKPNLATFSAVDMGIDTEPFAHFALGLLWKAAVHQWPTVAGQTTTVNLGSFEDPIRRYLLGETGLPDDVYVILAVCEDNASRGMVLGPSLVAGSVHQMFSILVRGSWFHIVADRKPSPGTREFCCVRSERKLIHRENCERRLLQAGRHLSKTAAVSPNVKLKNH
jgi:hypothetical protein